MLFPSLSLFLVELKTVIEWYLLGIHLGIETHHLDEIAASFGLQGVGVCLAKVYGEYKDCKGGPPSWEVVTEALGKMDKIALADEIKKKYLVEEMDTTSTGDSESDDSTTVESCGDELRIFIDEKVKKEFEIIRGKYSKVITAIRIALREKAVDIGDLQSVVQDHCGLQPLPSESATLDSVFQRMKQHTSCFDVELLLKVADQFVKKMHRKIQNYCHELDKFKSSALMKRIVEDIKEKRKAPSAGTKVVTLKVSQAWNNTTMREFEKLVNIVLHEVWLNYIQVAKGCMCITWIAPDVEVGKIADCNMVYNKHFMDAIAVLSLSIGDEEIYRRQDQSDTPVSLDSALLQAIEKGVIDAVELLLAVGTIPSGDTAISVIVNMRAEDGWTVLHSAYRHADVTSLLLCEGCDPNVVDNDGRTPIMVASKYGYCDTVATLIDAGADVNKATNTCSTPLIEAARAGHDNIVATLIGAGAGADVNKATDTDTTPLIAAAWKGHDNIVATLIGAGADVNKATNSGATSLILAARAGHENIVTLLIDAGADVNKATVSSTTPLMAADRAGHDKIVRKLIVAGAKRYKKIKELAYIMFSSS